MSPIEILGKLLGAGKAGGGGRGGLDELNDMFGGERSSKPTRGGDPSVSARDLEDMLGVGNSSKPAPAPSRPTQNPYPTPPQTRPSSSVNVPSSSGHQGFPGDIFGRRQQTQQVSLAVPKPQHSQDDEAVLLIRAMINAAKVDGDINADEQQFILERVGDDSQSTIQFLRTEFARPIDIREYADSIPVGLEQKIYLVSLMAIKLDTKQEADYLRSLGAALRLSPDTLNQIHKQQNATLLYN
jgi:hypothetical protein